MRARRILALAAVLLAGNIAAAEPNLDYYFPRTPLRPAEACLDYYYPRPAPAAALPTPKGLRFRILREHRKVDKGNSFFADIVNHNRDEPKDFGEHSTTAHETTHAIHSQLRTRYSLALGRRVNAFYLGRDRFVILDEPALRKSDLAEFVPASLRGDRYALYVENQKEWDDTPLYIFDEWVAYVNGSEVALEEAKGKKTTRSNETFACAEFAVYAAALGMAVEKRDARYFARHKAFRAFLAWHLQRSLAVYRRGAARPEFAWKPDYYRTLQSGSDAAALRRFCEQSLGLNARDLFQ